MNINFGNSHLTLHFWNFKFFWNNKNNKIKINQFFSDIRLNENGLIL